MLSQETQEIFKGEASQILHSDVLNHVYKKLVTDQVNKLLLSGKIPTQEELTVTQSKILGIMELLQELKTFYPIDKYNPYE